MVPGLDIESLNAQGKLISRLERFELEGAIPKEFDLAELFHESEQTFFCVQGLASFWNGHAGAEFGQHVVDLVIGAHNQRQVDLTLVMLGTPQKLAIYISLGTEQTTRTLLEGMFPGIILESISPQELAGRLPSHFTTMGILTGIPGHKAFNDKMRDSRNSHGQNALMDAAERQEHTQLERVIRGMYGATWAYVVQAHPRPRHKLVEDRMKTIDLLTQITSRSQFQWQASSQDNVQLTTSESGSQSRTYSGNTINYRAQYLMRLLERELERLDQASAVGQWTVRTCFGASNIDDAQRLASLLLGALTGPDSHPEPLRAAICQKQGISSETFHTFLTSNEVASLIQLPREEVPGYAVHDYVLFDVDFRAPDSITLPLGHIQQNGRDTCNTFNISLDALAKHTVVIGVTGSGKTTTVMNLLDHMVEAGRPFLVIEPAKTEYRSLHSTLIPRANLRVYTLGNEMVAPFRLNPFEFETDDAPGSVSLLAHIDFLKAVFNAAFVLYAPMPHVLEEALHEVYEDKGWDLTSGTNKRIPNWSERHLYPIFPTLTDLYYKVEAVTNRLGYHHEVESNVKAGLKARIGSLRIGSKGLMLDTARGIPMQALLTTPTILEMENIGSDDEKTFLMGLFLARLYEYRRLQAATNADAKGLASQGLKHLIVFEEAHRLLQNTPTQVSDESSNMRAQAIEVFTNMLSEMRAYGQGVLVAEQIPSKLAPDVLKNTNLKIVHRLIAQDDRQSIGQTMNLNEAQRTHLGILTPGMAAVYAEGADHAYLVRLENYKRKISPLVDAELKQMSRAYASVESYQAITDLHKYGISMAHPGGPDPAIDQAASKLLNSAKSRWLWANILLRLVWSPTRIFEMIVRFSEHIEAEMPHLSPDQHEAMARMVLVLEGAEIMHARGAQFGWTFAQVEELRVLLTRGLVGFIQANQTARTTNLDAEELTQQLENELDTASEYLTQFASKYITLMRRRQGPFVGCTHCFAKCLYRSDVSVLLSVKDRKRIYSELTSTSHASAAEHYGAIGEAAAQIAQKWLGEGAAEPASIAGISYCAALHVAAAADFSEYEQTLVGDRLQQYILEAE